jgi:hypothetical protein
LKYSALTIAASPAPIAGFYCKPQIRQQAEHSWQSEEQLWRNMAVAQARSIAVNPKRTGRDESRAT